MSRPLSTMAVLTEGGVFDQPIFIKIETVADMTVPVTIAATNVVAVDDEEDDDIVKGGKTPAPNKKVFFFLFLFLLLFFLLFLLSRYTLHALQVYLVEDYCVVQLNYPIGSNYLACGVSSVLDLAGWDSCLVY